MNAIIEAFEEEYALGHCAELRDYLPDRDHPDFTPIAVELIRVDLERARSEGIKRRLEDYRTIAPSLFRDPVALGEIAYEEFRLRRLAGEAVDVDEYARRFALDTASWPAPIRPAQGLRSPLSNAESARGSEELGGRGFPSVGDDFAGFELVELLGRGAFGIVFRARQRDLARREVVLKLSAIRTVEPQRLARLQHTNIVPIYSVHQDHEWLGICMPFMGRDTLADISLAVPQYVGEQVKRSTVAGRDGETVRHLGPLLKKQTDAKATVSNTAAAKSTILPIDTIVEWTAQLAEGLAHAHARGIVHSDLKPANVLLADDGIPLLLDFNLSDDVNSAPAATLMVGGTLPYMAPEHLTATLNGGLVRAESDIYSLGVIFFELLTGKRPYPDRVDSTDDQLANMIRDRQQVAPCVRSFNSLISPSIAAVVAHCLEPAVARYSSAAEMAEDLRRHQQALPLKFAQEPSARERFRKWRIRNARSERVAAMIGMALMLVSAGAVALVRQHRVEVLQAATEFSEFREDVLTASLHLNSPGHEPELKSVGRSAATAALSRFGSLDNDDKKGNATFLRLTKQQQDEVRSKSVNLKYLLAETPQARQRLLDELAETSDIHSYLRGIQLLERGSYAEAQRHWLKLSKQDRHDPTRWLLLGNAYRGQGRFADAEACYTAVIALQPQAMAGYLYRGQCRYQMHKYVDAEADFTAVVELRPKMPCGLMNRALAWHALGASTNAERDATAAISAGLKDPRAYFVRANIRESLGDLSGAREDRAVGFDLKPIDEFGWIARGIVRLRDNPQLAQQEFEAGLAEFPMSVALQENLIHVYADRLQQFDAALLIADRRVKQSPNDPKALATRAVIDARLGKRPEAHRDAKKAAKRPLSPIFSLQLACVYAITSRSNPSDVTLSIEHLQQALAGDPRLAIRAAADPDLVPIRSTVEYASLLDAAMRLVKSAPATQQPLPKTDATIADHD